MSLYVSSALNISPLCDLAIGELLSSKLNSKQKPYLRYHIALHRGSANIEIIDTRNDICSDLS